MNYVVKHRDSDDKWLVKGFDNDSENGTGAEKIGI